MEEEGVRLEEREAVRREDILDIEEVTDWESRVLAIEDTSI